MIDNLSLKSKNIEIAPSSFSKSYQVIIGTSNYVRKGLYIIYIIEGVLYISPIHPILLFFIFIVFTLNSNSTSTLFQ